MNERTNKQTKHTIFRCRSRSDTLEAWQGNGPCMFESSVDSIHKLELPKSWWNGGHNPLLPSSYTRHGGTERIRTHGDPPQKRTCLWNLLLEIFQIKNNIAFWLWSTFSFKYNSIFYRWCSGKLSLRRNAPTVHLICGGKVACWPAQSNSGGQALSSLYVEHVLGKGRSYYDCKLVKILRPQPKRTELWLLSQRFVRVDPAEWTGFDDNDMVNKQMRHL